MSSESSYLDESSFYFQIKPPNYFTKPEFTQRPEDVTEKYTFYFTGSTKDHLMKGINVELNTSMDPSQCSDKLLKELEYNKVNIKERKLLIYLPGGIPFIGGTLGDIYLGEDIKVKKVIYGVLTRQISDSLLIKPCFEICNASDKDHELFLSPFCESTKRGLSDIACLLGYICHGGLNDDLFLRACAAVIRFPPLITSMKRIIDNRNIINRDVVTVCSSLYTFFRAYLPTTILDTQVFEYALRICNLIARIDDLPFLLPLIGVKVESDSGYTKFLYDLKLSSYVYFWRVDIGQQFEFVDFKVKSFSDIENAYDLKGLFTPIMPYQISYSPRCSIVNGKTHEYLYLMHSSSKDAKSQNLVDIIDPFIGVCESKDIDVLEKEITEINDPDQIKQIIMINLDESNSMIDPNSDKDERVAIAIQYLTIFANQIYNSHIPSIIGLVTFNDTINVRCQLSPFISDFEKVLNNIQPNSTPKLYDSIIRSSEEIVNFKNDKYNNATSRILVVSSSDDVNSNAKVEDVVKTLIQNKIIVDSLIISQENDCKMLCAISHATGGVSFKPKDFKEGISICELSAFINYEIRKASATPLISGDRSTIYSRLKIEKITNEFMNKVKNNAEFDTEITNREVIQSLAKVRLATPSHICEYSKENNISNSHMKRILKEFQIASEICDMANNPNFDPDLKFYVYQANFDRMKVFLKGPDGTPYANKWWNIYIKFSEFYPAQPPILRFASIPYHLNVSSDGRICQNIIESGYFPSIHVIDIIQQIKGLFLIPDIESPLNIEAYGMYLNNYENYERLALESAKNNGKDDFHDYISSTTIANNVPTDFKVDVKDHYPLYLLSQITGKTIKNDKMIKASSGVYYDKDELRNIIASSKNPVCAITGKILTEKPEDFEDTNE